MRRLMRTQGFAKNLAALLGLIVVGVLVGGYVLDHQRLRFPLIDETPLRLRAELPTAQAVTPGQGQTIRVAGVRIGDIGQIDLDEGRAYVELVIDDEFRDVVRTDATALLRPKTGLKDMFLEVNPGSPEKPVAEEGWTMPVQNTLPDVNPDEILSSLDADVRDHVRSLLSDASTGLDGRGEDLRAVLKRFEPTHRSLARVSGAVRTREKELRRLVTSLAEVNEELASRDEDLSEVVGHSAKVFRALASSSEGLKATISELPSALRTTRRALAEADRLGRVLGPSTKKLLPVPGALQRANAATTPFAREAAPLLRADIRPFVREARPLVRSLTPAAEDLAAAEPGLTRTFKVLNRFFNMLAHNPGGREGPDDGDRNEGFLFHLGWVGHQSTNLFANQDANGVFRPVILTAPCQALRSTVQSNTPGNPLTDALAGVLNDPALCGTPEPEPASRGGRRR